LYHAPIGISPLTLAADKKSLRMLASRFVVMPAATGLMAANEVAIVGRSSAMREGTFPRSLVTRTTDECKSRLRIGESAVLRSTAASTSAKVLRVARGSAGLLVLLVMVLPFGFFGVAPSGLGWTGGDWVGLSGSIAHCKGYMCTYVVFPKRCN
jgi:hypothetical protein